MIIRTFTTLPPTASTLAKVALSAVKARHAFALPQAEYRVPNLKIDRARLKAYQRVCACMENDTLPPLYLGTLAMRLQLNMMADEDFPYPVLGLVHIHNSVTQHRPVRAHESLALSCRFGDNVAHDKGTAFTFVSNAKVNGELVWESTATYLHRERSTGQSKPPRPAGADSAAEAPVSAQRAIDINIHLPEDLGRRYAKVSGDYNPIHLSALTARLFGFKRAIAHGMWSKARVLAQLDLPDAFAAEVQFKLPAFLPAGVHLHAHTEGRDTVFALTAAQTGKPHLTGTLTPL